MMPMIDEHEPAFFERPFRERKQGARAAFRNRSASDFSLLRAVLCATSQAPSDAICESSNYLHISIINVSFGAQVLGFRPL